MKKTVQFLIFFSILIMLVMPVLSLAAQDSTAGLVLCTTDCRFNDLMAMVNKVINFMLFGMAIPIVAIMFAYAGFRMITAGSSAAEEKTKAKEMLTNVVYGFILAMASWLIIHTILSILGYGGSWIGL